jgi:hypothetical protein
VTDVVAAAIAEADAHPNGFNPFGFREWPLGAQARVCVAVYYAVNQMTTKK